MTTSELMKELQTKPILDLKGNEVPCTKCNGLRFTYVEENGKGYIEGCRTCHNGKLYKCEFCGKLNTTDYCNCDLSRAKRKSERIKGSYEKAKKIKYSEYKTEWLYDENSDEFYKDKEALMDFYYDAAYGEDIPDEEIQYPKWAFGCTEIPFVLDIDHALESASEEMHEDFDYDRDLTDVNELYDFIKQWNEKQSAMSYMVDYKTVVLLDE